MIDKTRQPNEVLPFQNEVEEEEEVVDLLPPRNESELEDMFFSHGEFKLDTAEQCDDKIRGSSSSSSDE